MPFPTTILDKLPVIVQGPVTATEIVVPKLSVTVAFADMVRVFAVMLKMVVPPGIPVPVIVAPTNKLCGLLLQVGTPVNVRVALPDAVVANWSIAAVVAEDANASGVLLILKY